MTYVKTNEQFLLLIAPLSKETYYDSVTCIKGLRNVIGRITEWSHCPYS